MKYQFVTIAIGLLLSVSALAMPKVNEDGSVSFYYKSGTAQSVSVNIAGKNFEMEQSGEGLFSVTTDTLPSDLYTYTYNINGIETLDPENLCITRDCNRRYNYLIVPGQRGNLYVQRAEVQHGAVVQNYYTTNDGKQHAMSIYLPPSYKTGKDYYPVLFLLHGTWGDCKSWLEMGRVAQIADNLIAEGKAKEMIIIMPNCNMWQSAAPDVTGDKEVWTDMMTTTNRMKDGQFEENFGNLINQIEKQYRVLTRKNSRAIAGLSRGGYFTFHISHFYNMMFDYVGMFSATYKTESKSKVYRNLDKDLTRQFQTPPALYYIAIGKNDFLYKENVQFRKMLDSRNIQYIYKESDGGHEWANWRDYLSDFMPRLF